MPKLYEIELLKDNECVDSVNKSDKDANTVHHLAVKEHSDSSMLCGRNEAELSNSSGRGAVPNNLRSWGFERKKEDGQTGAKKGILNGKNQERTSKEKEDLLQIGQTLRQGAIQFTQEQMDGQIKVLFNGFSYEQLVSYNKYLNIYQISCKPRILVEEPANGQASQRLEESEISSDTYGQHQLINSKLFDRLKECLLCQVCSDVFTRPLNVKDCLHKFCAKCIEDYNRKYKKECPQCRQ